MKRGGSCSDSWLGLALLDDEVSAHLRSCHAFSARIQLARIDTLASPGSVITQARLALAKDNR